LHHEDRHPYTNRSRCIFPHSPLAIPSPLHIEEYLAKGKGIYAIDRGGNRGTLYDLKASSAFRTARRYRSRLAAL
jgi:hypothetical protein